MMTYLYNYPEINYKFEGHSLLFTMILLDMTLGSIHSIPPPQMETYLYNISGNWSEVWWSYIAIPECFTSRVMALWLPPPLVQTYNISRNWSQVCWSYINTFPSRRALPVRPLGQQGYPLARCLPSPLVYNLPVQTEINLKFNGHTLQSFAIKEDFTSKATEIAMLSSSAVRANYRIRYSCTRSGDIFFCFTVNSFWRLNLIFGDQFFPKYLLNMLWSTI